jgi:hypothetical protein
MRRMLVVVAVFIACVWAAGAAGPQPAQTAADRVMYVGT